MFHFDYDPKHEPTVADYLPKLKNRLEKQARMRVLEIDLFQLVYEFVDSKGYLEKAYHTELDKGSDSLFRALKSLVRPAKLVTAVKERLAEGGDMVWITGVGAAWPLVRSHAVLNNLHGVLEGIPLVMYLPSEYTGQELRLLGEFTDDNYYHAFPLLPRTHTWGVGPA